MDTKCARGEGKIFIRGLEKSLSRYSPQQLNQMASILCRENAHLLTVNEAVKIVLKCLQNCEVMKEVLESATPQEKKVLEVINTIYQYAGAFTLSDLGPVFGKRRWGYWEWKGPFERAFKGLITKGLVIYVAKPSTERVTDLSLSSPIVPHPVSHKTVFLEDIVEEPLPPEIRPSNIVQQGGMLQALVLLLQVLGLIEKRGKVSTLHGARFHAGSAKSLTRGLNIDLESFQKEITFAQQIELLVKDTRRRGFVVNQGRLIPWLSQSPKKMLSTLGEWIMSISGFRVPFRLLMLFPQNRWIPVKLLEEVIRKVLPSGRLQRRHLPMGDLSPKMPLSVVAKTVLEAPALKSTGVVSIGEERGEEYFFVHPEIRLLMGEDADEFIREEFPTLTLQANFEAILEVNFHSLPLVYFFTVMGETVSRDAVVIFQVTKKGIESLLRGGWDPKDLLEMFEEHLTHPIPENVRVAFTGEEETMMAQ
jgi:hypothetical protein